MARKNIFQLVEENYDIQCEIRKLNDLFNRDIYFSCGMSNKTFKELIEGYLFRDWKFKNTCLNTNEYFIRAGALIDMHKKNPESTIINNIEVIENFIKLYYDNSDNLFAQHNIEYYSEFDTDFLPVLNTLEKRMGLTTREYKDKIIVYPKNAPLEKVLNAIEDEDVQWELIRYAREDMTLSEKRKSLAYLATNLYIEDDKTEINDTVKSLISKAGNILNNLHIRHNNKTGKWENAALKDITQKEALILCDMVFNEMLTIVLLREHKKYEETYKNFNDKQKVAKTSKPIADE